jgi:hypothetical protein
MNIKTQKSFAMVRTFVRLLSVVSFICVLLSGWVRCNNTAGNDIKDYFDHEVNQKQQYFTLLCTADHNKRITNIETTKGDLLDCDAIEKEISIFKDKRAMFEKESLKFYQWKCRYTHAQFFLKLLY